MEDIKKIIRQLNDFLWEIPKEFRADMRVPARIYASKAILEEILRDHSLLQLVNVATLPGIVGSALAMPDAHEGYGFPVGGVAAFDLKKGIISPGGIGYDINCGVRLLRSEITLKDIKPYLENLGRTFYHEVPSGVGRGGMLNLRANELDEILLKGARKIVQMGYGEEDDLLHTESNGELGEADPSKVSPNAKKRGADQLGTMGAGNHFVEVDVVETIYDEEEARKMNLFPGQITVQIHTGSRGLGHQIATDYIRLMVEVMPRYGITIPDRELACAPFSSPEGRDYFSAMCAGANFAWANRQMITWEVRQAWRAALGSAGAHLHMVYDAAHNIAKVEEYEINGKKNSLVVHRKGATRSFPGQPVLIPGSMGTRSYVLVGQEKSLTETFGSSCHGAGRRMSRSRAKKEVQTKELRHRLKSLGITVNTGSSKGLTEEAPEAYKDVDEVVAAVHQAGLAKKVARLRPIAVIKG